MDFYKELKDYSQKALLLARKYIRLSDFSFDHVCYQTESSKDYEKALDELSKHIEERCELPHAGRRITVARLKDSIKLEGVVVDKVEISEPKPKRTVQERHFDHMAFVTDDFDKSIDKLRKEEVKITEVKSIGKHRIAKFVEDGVEIEIRNIHVCDELVNDKKDEDDKQVNANDERDDSSLKDQIKKEREAKLRALADYQNLQRRLENERMSIRSMANSEILGKLLEVMDDFDRALTNMKVSEEDQVGIRMVRGKLDKIVDDSGLEEIECEVGDDFDPNNFEAVGVVAVDKKDDNKVQEIVQTGYKMTQSDSVVRPVKVIVGKTGEEEKE